MALEKNGIDFKPEFVLKSFRSMEDSYKKIQAVIKKGIKFDGIVSVGGLITYGAGKAILASNLSIPKDVIIGEFGDNNIVYRLGVPFFSVFQYPYEIGKASVDLLIKLIETRKDDEEFENIIINTKIIKRM